MRGARLLKEGLRRRSSQPLPEPVQAHLAVGAAMPRGKLTGTRVSGAILSKPTDQIGAMAAGHPCRRPAGGAAPKPPPSLTGMAPKGFGWFACEKNAQVTCGT